MGALLEEREREQVVPVVVVVGDGEGSEEEEVGVVGWAAAPGRERQFHSWFAP